MYPFITDIPSKPELYLKLINAFFKRCHLNQHQVNQAVTDIVKNCRNEALFRGEDIANLVETESLTLRHFVHTAYRLHDEHDNFLDRYAIVNLLKNMPEEIYSHSLAHSQNA